MLGTDTPVTEGPIKGLFAGSPVEKTSEPEVCQDFKGLTGMFGCSPPGGTKSTTHTTCPRGIFSIFKKVTEQPNRMKETPLPQGQGVFAPCVRCPGIGRTFGQLAEHLRGQSPDSNIQLVGGGSKRHRPVTHRSRRGLAWCCGRWGSSN
jgi:hypothetical protein